MRERERERDTHTHTHRGSEEGRVSERLKEGKIGVGVGGGGGGGVEGWPDVAVVNGRGLIAQRCGEHPSH